MHPHIQNTRNHITRTMHGPQLSSRKFEVDLFINFLKTDLLDQTIYPIDFTSFRKPNHPLPHRHPVPSSLRHSVSFCPRDDQPRASKKRNHA